MYHSHDRLADLLRFYEHVFSDLKGLLSDSPHPVFPRERELRESLELVRRKDLSKEEFFKAFQEVMKHSVKLYSPYYFGHMDSGVLQEFAVIDAVISFLNQNLLSWELSPFASLIEKEMINELGMIFGLPESRGGTFVSGGTIANLTGLLLALRSKYPSSREEGVPFGVHEVFVSEQAHYSVQKAASIIGLGTKAIRSVKVNNEFQVDLNDLEKQLGQASDPIAIIGIAGTTNTGSIDDLQGISQLAREFNVWFHVDAAYGGALMFHSKKKALLKGIELADSITFDPHKWLWAPKSTAVLLVRDRSVLQTFDHFAPYIPIHSDTTSESLVWNYGKKTIQGSRRFDALRYWVLTRYFGRSFIEKSLDKTFGVTDELVELVVRSRVFDLVTTPETTIVCFRVKEELVPDKKRREEIVSRVHEIIEKSGVAWISMTQLKEEKVLRFVILNLNSTVKVVRDVFRFIERVTSAEIGYLGDE